MRYFFGFLITIGLIILVIFLLFRGGGDKPRVPATSKPLASYATTGAEASMTIDGPVNANSLHQQLRITVDRNNVTFEELKGYNGDVVKMERFGNTESAYAVFLLALSRVGFTKGDVSPALRDERGFCPSGSRYIFEFNEGSKQLERYWATSCGGAKTYLGALNPTINLFTAQVPDYQELSGDIEL